MPLSPQLQETLKSYTAPGDLTWLEQVYVQSVHLHQGQDGTGQGQQRLEAVACELAQMRMDPPCIAAALLADVLEGKLLDEKGLLEEVGENVTRLVVEVSRLAKATYHSSESARAEHMRQMILASTKDLRVILILLAQRLVALRHAEALPAEKATLLARETQAIYAPIAHRLGVYSFKAELEDLAFLVLEPQTYQALSEEVEERVSARKERIQQINIEMETLLQGNGIEGEVLGRTKHLFSIHGKMQRNQVGLDQIYDLLASRIIVENEALCYRVLGLIHARYTPMPGKFKDYIALPKANGYRSLHTLVFGGEGELVEIQIRTQEMHRMAELGVAAHFAYKAGQEADAEEIAQAQWFRRMLENLDDGQDPQESLDLMQRDLGPDRIFVFTPTGEVIKLPAGATPIDFAYAVHSQVGDHCVGARMDRQMVSIRTPLQNGSVVEILTSTKQEPHEDWLNYAVSSKALSRIRSFLRARAKEGFVRLGRELWAKEAKRRGKKPEVLLADQGFSEWMRRSNYPQVEEFFNYLGQGKIELEEVTDRYFGAQPDRTAKTEKPASEADTKPTGTSAKTVKKTKSAPSKARSRSQVHIAGVENLLVRFAKCCEPVFGDPITGIITQARGVSVHHQNCRNLKAGLGANQRMLSVEWVDENRKERPVTLAITAPGIRPIMELLAVLEAEENTPITSGRLASKKGKVIQHLTVKVQDSRQLKRILGRLNGMPGIQAERIFETA